MLRSSHLIIMLPQKTTFLKRKEDTLFLMVLSIMRMRSDAVRYVVLCFLLFLSHQIPWITVWNVKRRRHISTALRLRERSVVTVKFQSGVGRGKMALVSSVQMVYEYGQAKNRWSRVSFGSPKRRQAWFSPHSLV